MTHRTAFTGRLRCAGLAAAIVALATVAGCNVSRSGDGVEVQPIVPPKGLYEDLGPADKGSEFRALIALPLRDRGGLEATIDALYDPTSTSFRRYLTRDQLLAAHAPKEIDVAAVRAWLEGHGFAVPFVATNRVLVEFTGTIASFEAAFDTEVHIFLRPRDATSTRDTLFAPSRPLTIPAALDPEVSGVLTIDPVAETDPIAADVQKDPGPLPAGDPALAPSVIRERYGFAPIRSRGEGQAIGIVAGFSFKPTDAQAFWRTFGISRSDPEIVRVAEPASSRNVETALDVEWAGALAPGARLVVYEAPDVKDTALVFALNEAVGRAEVSVLTDSFSRRETSVSRALAEQYEVTAQMAAALGITIVAASGDSNAVDVPASCPHVTAVGGTSLAPDGAETVWEKAGAGPSRYFDAPAWAAALAERRTIPDVSLNADTHYWVVSFGAWDRRGGTSFASPIFGALVTVMNAERAAGHRPPVGFLNPILYGDSKVQRAFRDIVEGESDQQVAKAGWDSASGWGSPHAANLLAALP